MSLRFVRRAASLAALAAVGLTAAPTAQAQFRDLSQDARGVVPSPVRLAQGDAYAATPLRQTALFGNPAHLSYLTGRLPKVTLTATAGLGGNVREAYDYYRQDLGPAIEQGLDEIRQTDPDRLEALYNEALRIGVEQKTARSAVELSGTFTVQGVGVGVGVAGTGVTRGQMFNNGGGIPFVDMYAQADLLVPVAVSYKLAGPALGTLASVSGAPSSVAIGAQGTFVRRWLTVKSGSVDSFDPDAEKLYLLSGAGALFDLGLHATDVGLDGLDLGVVGHNIFGSAIGLSYDRAWAVSGSENAPDDAAEIVRVQNRFATRGSGAAFRTGVAYRIPVPPTPGVGDVRVMLDYTTASTSEYDQSFQAGLRLGAQATLAGALDLRAGVSQGMPSLGASLKFPGVRLDYAFYGVEDGALLGQRPRAGHMLQLRFGIY